MFRRAHGTRIAQHPNPPLKCGLLSQVPPGPNAPIRELKGHSHPQRRSFQKPARLYRG